MVSIVAANRDPAIWGEDAGVWRPGRWLGEGTDGGKSGEGEEQGQGEGEEEARGRWQSGLPRSVAEAHLPGIYSQMCVLSLLRVGGVVG